MYTVISGNALKLAAYISAGGLHGEVRFEQKTENSIRIRFALQTTLQYPDQQWFWSITQFPVDYTVIEDRCSRRHLGERYLKCAYILLVKYISSSFIIYLLLVA